MTALLVFVRMLGEMGLWLGVGGLVLSIFMELSDLTFALPVLAVVPMLSHVLGGRKRGLSLVPLPLLALALLLCRKPGDWLLVIPAMLYCGAAAAMLRLTPDRNALYYRFVPMVAAGLVSAFLALLAGLSWSFFCCAAGLLGCIFLSRVLRHDRLDSRDRPLILLETAFLAVLCLFCFLLSRQVVLDWLWEAVKGLFLWVGLPAIMAVLYILQVVVWLVAKLFPAASEAPAAQGFGGFLESQSAELEDLAGGTGSPAVFVIVRLVLAAVFLIAAWFALQYLRRGSGKLTFHPGGKEETVLAADRERAAFSPPSFLDRSPEAAVRRSYGAYCRRVQASSRPLEPRDTSRTVNVLAHREEDPAARELRSLYLRARYSARSGLTREDARRAAALVRELNERASGQNH